MEARGIDHLHLHAVGRPFGPRPLSWRSSADPTRLITWFPIVVTPTAIIYWLGAPPAGGTQRKRPQPPWPGPHASQTGSERSQPTRSEPIAP